MRKWFWLVLLVLVVLGGIAFLHQKPSSVEPMAKNQVESKNRPVAIPQSVDAPKVDSKQLESHIKALNFKRYTQPSRDRARNYITQSLKKRGWMPTLQPFEGGVKSFPSDRVLIQKQEQYL